MGKERAYSAKPSITSGDQCRASLPGLAVPLGMGAASHWPHARSLRPSGAVSPHTPQKPSGQIPCQQLQISLDYMLPCMLLCARSRDLLSCRRQAPGGVRQVAVAGGGWRVASGGRRMVADIMTSVDIIV